MYSSGFNTHLAIAGLMIWMAGIVILRKPLGTIMATCVTALRIVPVVIFFSFYFDGQWGILDDVTYYHQGRQLIEMGIHPFSVLFDEGARDKVHELAGGPHILYLLWNALAQRLFGDYYWSAVFLNIFATFLAARCLIGTAGLADKGREYQRNLGIFSLLHWDIVSWSSILNVKDILVLLLTVAALFSFLKLYSRVSLANLFLFLGCLLPIFWLRYYLLPLLLISAAIWVLLLERSWWRFLLTGIIAAIFVTVVPHAFEVSWEYIYGGEIALGVVRYLLTPQPWSVAQDYSFLLPSSILHWLFFPAFVLGGVFLWRSSTRARLAIVYVLILTFFYSFVPELSGPRHRVQIVPFITWMQFEFFVVLIRRRGAVV